MNPDTRLEFFDGPYEGKTMSGHPNPVYIAPVHKVPSLLDFEKAATAVLTGPQVVSYTRIGCISFGGRCLIAFYALNKTSAARKWAWKRIQGLVDGLEKFFEDMLDVRIEIN